MTNDQAISGAKIIKPRPNSIKLSFQCGENKASKTILIDREFLNAEEKMMDEEITSIESTLDEDENVEQAMLTAALINSVADSSIVGNSESVNHTNPNNQHLKESRRSGLRKVRRSSGSDLKRLEHFQTTRDGGMARATGKYDESLKTDSSLLIPGVNQIAAKSEKPTVGRNRRQAKDSIQLKTQIISSTSCARTAAALLPITSVPNPLAFPVPNQNIAAQNTIQPREDLLPSIPCPLSLPALDAYQFDSEPIADVIESKPKVTFTESFGQRDRGFSIDLDLALEFVEEQTTTDSNEYHTNGHGRDRAYSFECFAFGFNSDEPLPPVDEASSSNSMIIRPRADSMILDTSSFLDLGIPLRRPRGDSIIFDPCSFQDGGIHEMNALERAPVLTDENVDILVDNLLHGIVSSNEPSDFFPSISLSNVISLSSSANVEPLQTKTDEKVLSTSHASVASGLPNDILNKDGRIGMYLPEERRVRIARFHAKRANRIWRKRIKYDCRKKLADSRPRIKGRFVKRLETDEV